MDEYARGFEHAVRNIVSSIERQYRQEDVPERKLGLRVALDTARGFHGFMSGGEKITAEDVRAKLAARRAGLSPK